MGKQIDGLTGQVFDTKEEYLNHVSPVTGYKPTDIEHHGTQGLLIAKKALARTGSLTKKKEEEIDKKIKKVKDEKVDEKIKEARKSQKGTIAKL